MKFKTYNIKVVTIDRDDLEESNVPCGDCHACCIELSPILTENEFKIGKYIYTLLNSGNNNLPVISVPRNEKGCIYFDGEKCTIYNDRPLACRQFDCRKGHYIKLRDLVLNKFGVDIAESEL